MQGAGHRIAITGYGVVAPCGIGKEAFWNGLIGPGFTGLRSIELQDWDPLPYFDSPKDARRSDRCEQFALAAAAEAFAAIAQRIINETVSMQDMVGCSARTEEVVQVSVSQRR